MRPKGQTYEEWLKFVNSLTLANHFMSIYELEDEIPREVLRDAYERGMSSNRFVEAKVLPLFYPEKQGV